MSFKQNSTWLDSFKWIQDDGDEYIENFKIDSIYLMYNVRCRCVEHWRLKNLPCMIEGNTDNVSLLVTIFRPSGAIIIKLDLMFSTHSIFIKFLHMCFKSFHDIGKIEKSSYIILVKKNETVFCKNKIINLHFKENIYYWMHVKWLPWRIVIAKKRVITSVDFIWKWNTAFNHEIKFEF